MSTRKAKSFTKLLPHHKKLASEARAFSADLLAWYDDNARPLPWRVEQRLYRTVVSEFMCQQTQIATVLPYFERWMVRFPDFQALAEAEEAEVVKHWEGLGYYTRARNLHKLAKAISALDVIPTGREDWLGFPGIGPYTSAAITSIAFGEKEAVVDGNVVRILSRLTAEEQEFPSGSVAMGFFGPLAQELISSERSGDHNQAMMELGATLCSRQNPLCTVCPVVRYCVAGRRGDADTLPRLRKRVTEVVMIDRVVIVEGGKILLHRIPTAARRLAGMLELPRAEELEYSSREGDLLLAKKRGISNQRITERFFRLDAFEGELPLDHEWIDLNEVDKVTLSGPHRKWLKEILNGIL